MKTTKFQVLIVCFFFVACLSEKQDSDNANNELKSELFANEYGEICLVKENDTVMRTIFKNNEGDVFDTIMSINHNFKMILKNDSFPFLQFHTGGIELSHDCLFIHEFSGVAYLSQFIQIEEMYSRPFYKVNEEVTVKGDVLFNKGIKINGIWLIDAGTDIPEEYLSVCGTIKKEKYPIDYYSTEESPQGMFSDTSIVHYRLIMEDYTIEEIPKQIFNGTAVNIDNQAAFISDLACSEAYYLDKRKPWSEAELNNRIVIEAVLIQTNIGKSVLKNWQIIEALPIHEE
ncbi:MAG: hypothetical protein PF448_03135 [Bacteroidales bacterium]|jgi:hypothetical protein|nr:hypothetical protein [Bacteroidales bacterium]